MKNHSRQFSYLLGALSFVLLTSAAYAQPAGSDSPGGKFMRDKKEQRIAEVYEKLGLTEEQKKQLKAHREKHREGMKVSFEAIHAKKDELGNEIQKSDLNMDRVTQIHSEVKALMGQKADERLKGILEVRTILTPEQFSKFMEIKKEHKKKRRERWKGSDSDSDWHKALSN